MNIKKRAEITMRFSEFEMPPMQDILVIGKLAPIGPEAARHMINVISPDQYEIIKIDHDSIEAIVARKSLFTLIPHDTLIGVLVEECGKITDATVINRGKIDIALHINRSVDL